MPKARAVRSIIYDDKHVIRYGGKTVGFTQRTENGYRFIPTDYFEQDLPATQRYTLGGITALVEQELGTHG